MGKRRGKVRGGLQTTNKFGPPPPPPHKLDCDDGGFGISSIDDENIVGKRWGKARGRLQTTKSFRPLPPPRRKLGGGDGGSRSSSTVVDDEYGERQCVCLLLEDGEYDEEISNVNVFAIDIRGGGRFHKLLLLPEAKHVFRLGRGYGALASTLYRIGGAYLKPTDSEPSFHATDVWYCDLSYGIDHEKKKEKEKKGDFEITEEDIVLRCHGWRRGPSTLGAKPNPLIVTARGKMYALAGRSIEGWNRKYSSGPKFEVFDPRLREWEALPDPPFASRIYFINGLRYWGHAVIGDLIFIKVALNPNCIGRTILASFDMVKKLWNTYNPQETPKDAVLDNLRRCCWEDRAPIYNNKMFTCYIPYAGVFAHNLLVANYRRVKIDSDDSSDDEIGFFPIPVRGSGLEDAATIKKSAFTTPGCLTHLGKNNFCLFCPYDRRSDSYIRTCTFSVGDEKERQRHADDDDDETLLRAENVISQDKPIAEFGIGEMVTLAYEWYAYAHCAMSQNQGLAQGANSLLSLNTPRRLHVDTAKS
ncbi:hypothetical protein LguiB_001517 [Lonicera macranthoides]